MRSVLASLPVLLLAVGVLGSGGIGLPPGEGSNGYNQGQAMEYIRQQLQSQSQGQNSGWMQRQIGVIEQNIIAPYYAQSGHAPMTIDSLQRASSAAQAFFQYRFQERRAKQDGVVSPEEQGRLDQLRAAFEAQVGELKGINPGLASVVGNLPKTGFGSGGQTGGQSGGGTYEDPCAGRNRWRCALQQGNKPDALADLDEVLKEDPGNVEALNARSTLFFEGGNFQAANADARRALQADPSNQAALAMFKLTEGRGNSQEGNLAGEVAQADIGPLGQGTGGAGPATVSLPPISMTKRNPAAEGAVKSAQDALRVGDTAGALGHLSRALAADPENVEALSLRAMAFTRLGRHDLSLRDVEAGLRRAPRNTSLFVIKAFNKNRQKDYRGALTAAGEARDIDPGNVDALANYAHALGGLGQRGEMLSLLEQAAARDPRYQASLEDARNRPVGSDIFFLFPGEAGGDFARAAYDPKAGRPSRARRYGVLAGAAALGGLLVALGLLRSVGGPLTQRFKTAFTPAPEAAEPAGPPTLTPRPLTSPDSGLLRGQYRVLRQIGAGGMGLVFEGADVTLSRPVAVKKMRDELRLGRRERLRFINEAKTVAALHHPNIVDIYAIIEEGDDLFLVFEFVNGHTVHELVVRRGGLGWRESLGVARSMAAALDYAHGRGVIHRDLKPSNVMINKEGFVKVMDFGIARVAKDAATRVSMTNTVVGTPPYMAPEQERGVVRKEADVYSLAICLYEMLSGRLAFTGTGAGMLMNKMNMAFSPLSQSVAGLPPGLDGVFARAFQADPDKRFHSAGELLAALDALPSV
ncbi:MAG: protein kinase [Elusimicrobia bacterium]|nr:protein kinase [Elusimicrobiota bacterium]